MDDTTTPAPVTSCIRAINNRDIAAFSAAFSDDCVVNDIGRVHRGKTEIAHWAEREIFAVRVAFEVLGVSASNGVTTVRVKVDGTFDKTGLPDPLIFRQHFTVTGNLISAWTCEMEKA